MAGSIGAGAHPAARANDPQLLNSQGVQALGAGDAARAAELFARAAAADPLAVALWLNLAKAQRELGDSDGERASLDKALEIDARHLMALVRKAELHERLGELAAATAAWAGALAVSPPLDQLPPALGETLARAQIFVGERTAQLAQAVDTGLAATRAQLAGTDLRRADAAIDVALGRRRVYLNECHGLHFPFLPADEFFERKHFSWLAEIEAHTDAIRTELADLLAHGDAGFAPYVTMPKGAPASKWSELDNSLRWGCYYLWKYGQPVAHALARCPATAAALAAIERFDAPGRGPTAFFSILQPHTRIPPHSGVSNIRAIVHLPLIVPSGCAFRVGGETREWRVGEAFAFDDTIEHEASNDSDEIRAVLIFDVWNPHLTLAERELLCAFYRTADASGHHPQGFGGM